MTLALESGFPARLVILPSTLSLSPLVWVVTVAKLQPPFQLASGGASSQLAQWCSWEIAFFFVQESSLVHSVGANAIVLSRHMIYLHAKYAIKFVM